MNRFMQRALRACLVILIHLLALPLAAEPLSLRDAVQAALADNPELQLFEFEFRAQDARSAQAALRPAPEVSMSMENFAGTGEAARADSAEFTLALSQILELGGKRDARIAVSGAGRGLLEVQRKSRQLDVLAEVTRRFIVVVAAQERQRLADDAVALAVQTVAGSEKRVKAARSPHAELDRARIALDRARLDQRRAQIQLDTGRRQLAASWGETRSRINGAEFGDLEARLFPLPEPGEYDELVERLAGNPDFLQFASEERLRDAEIRLATTARKPDITFGGGLRQLEASSDQAFVASISMPLFPAKRAQGRIAEMRANRELLDVDRRIAEVRAEAMLFELHHELAGAVQEATALRTLILPRAEEALRETRYAWERGRFGYLELVDAQREYLQLQETLIDVAASAHTLRAEIERLGNAPLVASTP